MNKTTCPVCGGEYTRRFPRDEKRHEASAKHREGVRVDSVLRDVPDYAEKAHDRAEANPAAQEEFPPAPPWDASAVTESPAEVWCSKCELPSVVTVADDPRCVAHGVGVSNEETVKILVLTLKAAVKKHAHDLAYRTAPKHVHQYGERAVANTRGLLLIAEQDLFNAEAELAAIVALKPAPDLS